MIEPGPRLASPSHQRFITQVEKAIGTALRAAAEPLLNALTVREVVQQGGSLRVVVEPRDPELPLDAQEDIRLVVEFARASRREMMHRTLEAIHEVRSDLEVDSGPSPRRHP